jgi:hypothetical protein
LFPGISLKKYKNFAGPSGFSFFSSFHLIFHCRKTLLKSFLVCLIGLVLCFGGGILLSTVFVHMIKEVSSCSFPENNFQDKDDIFTLRSCFQSEFFFMKQVRESLDEAIRKGVFPTRDLVYPFAELLICIGRSPTHTFYVIFTVFYYIAVQCPHFALIFQGY